MIQRILTIIVGALLLASCQHHPLWWGEEEATTPINLVIHWEGELAGMEPARGMRAHFFSLDDASNQGKADFPATGGRINPAHGSRLLTLAYHYYATNIYFRNDTEHDRFEAYFAPVTRETYSRAFPDQYTVASSADDFFVGVNEEYTVAGEGQPSNGDINIYPRSVLVTYNFIIKGVKNARAITETRGAITGMSGSYLLTQHRVIEGATTLLFSATKDGANNQITGSFRTFGKLDARKDFTIECIFPTATGTGYITRTWDVSSQVDIDTPVDKDNSTYEIIIEASDSDIEIPDPETGDGGSGFDIDVNDWPDEPVPVPL